MNSVETTTAVADSTRPSPAPIQNQPLPPLLNVEPLLFCVYRN